MLTDEALAASITREILDVLPFSPTLAVAAAHVASERTARFQDAGASPASCDAVGILALSIGVELAHNVGGRHRKPARKSRWAA